MTLNEHALVFVQAFFLYLYANTVNFPRLIKEIERKTPFRASFYQMIFYGNWYVKTHFDWMYRIKLLLLLLLNESSLFEF